MAEVEPVGSETAERDGEGQRRPPAVSIGTVADAPPAVFKAAEAQRLAVHRAPGDEPVLMVRHGV